IVESQPEDERAQILEVQDGPVAIAKMGAAFYANVAAAVLAFVACHFGARQSGIAPGQGTATIDHSEVRSPDVGLVVGYGAEAGMLGPAAIRVQLCAHGRVHAAVDRPVVAFA